MLAGSSALVLSSLLNARFPHRSQQSRSVGRVEIRGSFFASPVSQRPGDHVPAVEMAGPHAGLPLRYQTVLPAIPGMPLAMAA